MITVIDYGMGNLRSVVKAVEKYTDAVRVSSDPESIKTSDALIMPGDGAYGMAMEHLEDLGWIAPLKEYIQGDGYFMGICLGFQLLFASSEEFGEHKGLNIVPGKVVKFKERALKVPHMGWNTVKKVSESKFMEGIPDESYFYFIHSYYPVIYDKRWQIGEADYGVRFPCIVGMGNFIATQFHPEKSHNIGMKIIENFVKHAG
ncbi:MAG: imidazole glycerol phosphate synthase subunit HisH [bacterium]|nr:imidazole glycerol phosphate synthase subunit HisH [bacterium]